MIKYKNKEQVKKLMESIGQKELSFLITINKKEHFFCTCGDMHQIPKGLTNAKKLVCPTCGNNYTIDEPDYEKSIIPIRYTPEIYVDDNNFFIMGLQVKGLTLENWEIDVMEHKFDWVILYDKIAEHMYIMDNAYCEWWKMDGFYIQNNTVYSNNDLELANHIEMSYISNSLEDETGLYHANSYIYEQIYEKSGIEEVLTEISKRTKIKYEMMSQGVYFDDIFPVLLTETNIHWYNDMIKKNIKSNNAYTNFIISQNEKCIDNIAEFENAGINMSAKTVEEAFEMPLELLGLKTMTSYIESINSYRYIKSLQLRESHINWIKEIPSENWKYLIKISKQLECSLGDVITYFHRGINNGYKYHLIMDYIEEMIKADKKDLINICTAFTSKIKRRWEFVKSNLLTENEYETLINKPTLNTLYTIVGGKI